MKFLIDHPAIVVSILALVVAILSWLASADSAKSARKANELSQKIAEASRPRLDVEIIELDEIVSDSGVFRGDVVFKISNKGKRVAKDYTHQVFYLYNPQNTAQLKLGDYIRFAEKLPEQFFGGSVFPGGDETVKFSIAGETKSALMPYQGKTAFNILIIVAVSYTDEFTEQKHWTVETQLISQMNDLGQVDAAIVEANDFTISDIVIGRLPNSSMSN